MATIRRHQWQVRVVVGILMIFTFASPTSIRWRLFSTALTSQYQISNKIAIIGGGASGIFASIAASEHEHTIVTVLEATSKTLQKVKISGGGRCNVMHDTAKSIPAILSGYPRGNKELNGLYKKRFSPTMARDWFELRGWN
jgi:predicted flavoprotein YhiN